MRSAGPNCTSLLTCLRNSSTRNQRGSSVTIAVSFAGIGATNREKEELREILRVTTRGIQFACVTLIVRRLNEFAIHFRENKPSIDNLRLQLALVCRPVRL